MDAFWAFAKRMLRHRARIVLALVCALLGSAGLGAGLLVMSPAIGNVLGDNKGLRQIVQEADLPLGLAVPQGMIDILPTDPFATIAWVLAVMSVIVILGGIANFAHASISLQVVFDTITDLRRQAFHRVIRLPLKTVIARGTADTISRLVNDTSVLASGLTALLSKAVGQIGKGVAAFIAALIFDWRLTLIACIVAPVLAMSIRKLAKRVRRASRAALERQADLLGASTETLHALRVVKVHTTERYEMGRFNRINRQVMKKLLAARTARALSSPLNEVLALLALFALLLVSARFILAGELDAKTFMMTLGALFISAASLKPLTGIINEIQTAAGAATRVQELLGGELEPGHDRTLPRLPLHREALEFRNITFTYPGAHEPSLRGVSLVVPHGQTVAIVGPNGCGKTTLLSLVPRLFDADSGHVLIDGSDITKCSVRSLRRQIGVVTQETVIFQLSVASNIAYGATGATQADIVRAAVQARADEFIRRLPQGYETVVGERGSTLSGGQRQRLAIARAILRNPRILILDEATSMIDADSEAKIAEALAEFTRGRTCLVVAHRLSTVLSADRIVVMDQGQIVAEGRHEDLLRSSETYRLIAQRQMGLGVA